MILPRKHWWSRLWRLANAAALFAGWCLLLALAIGYATGTLDVSVGMEWTRPWELGDWPFAALWVVIPFFAIVITLNWSDYAFAWRCWRERPR